MNPIWVVRFKWIVASVFGVFSFINAYNCFAMGKVALFCFDAFMVYLWWDLTRDARRELSARLAMRKL